MKNRVLLLCAIALYACGTTTTQTKMSDQVAEEPFAESFAYIDSVREAGKPSLQKRAQAAQFVEKQLDVANGAEKSMDTATQEAQNRWEQFKTLCQEQKRAEALELFNAHKGDFYVYLTPSELSYVFHCEVLWPILSETQTNEVALQSMMKALEYDYFAVRAIMSFSNTGYVPIHYESLLQMLAKLHSAAGNLKKATRYEQEYVDYLNANLTN